MERVTRRKFIETTAAGTAGLLVGTTAGAVPAWASAWSPYQDDPPEFPQGVASGDPTCDGVMLWTRAVAAGPVEVKWEVSRTPRFSDRATRSRRGRSRRARLRRRRRRDRVVASGTCMTGPDRDWTVKVDVDGLASGRTYYYRFRMGTAVSRVGRTRTAPAGAASGLAFALASCQNWTAGYYAAWRHIAARDDLDFVLHVGDYIYESGGNDVRAHDPAREVLSVDDYRTRHRQYRSDADLRAAHAAHPFVVTFDDHEVTNNAWREGAEGHQSSEEDDPKEGDYKERRNRAYQGYDEYMPIRLPAGRTAEEMRVYRKLAFGDLLDVFMLDTRQYRDQGSTSPLPVPGPQTNPEIGAEGRTYLGAPQRKWLEQELVGSKARWKVLGNQAMLAQFTYGIWPDEAGRAMQELTGMPPDGHTVNSDQWDGYQAEQKSFLRFLREAQVRNTIVCTGDIHMSFANEVYEDEGKFRLEPPVAAEFVGPSITSNNFNETVGMPPRTASVAFEQAIRANNPHIRYAELDSNGYVVVRATPAEVVGEWYHLTGPPGGNAVRDPRASEKLATAWRVRDGDLRLESVGGAAIPTV